jgi:hypothetical protein
MIDFENEKIICVAVIPHPEFGSEIRNTVRRSVSRAELLILK